MWVYRTKRATTMKEPFRWSYNFGVFTYGDLEVLPQYQNIATPIRDFQAATAGFSLSKAATHPGRH
jgi:hypothetical protein